MKIFFLTGLLAATTVHAEDLRLAAAQKALNDGLPQVAVYQLQEQKRESWSTPADATAADLLLAQALFAAGRYSESAALLERARIDSDVAVFWQAESYAALGKAQAALPLYEKLTASKEFARQAVVGRARMQTALGEQKAAEKGLSDYLQANPSAAGVALDLAGLALARNDAVMARTILSKLSGLSGRDLQRARFIEVRTLLASGQAAEAEVKVHEIKDAPADMAADLAICLADSQIAQNKDGEAEKTLEVHIEDHPDLPKLADVFASLDRVYALEGASSSSELKKWSADGKSESREALALFYLARNEARSSKADLSRNIYAEFLQKYPDHALANGAKVELAASLLAANQPIEALTVLQGGKGARAAFLQGHALAALGKHQQAADSFLKAAGAMEDRQAALTNSAICAMLAGVPEEKNEGLRQLVLEKGGRDIAEKISYFEALNAAANRKPEAAALLKKIADGGSHYSQRAILALAEWENLQLNTKAARAELKRINSDDPATLEKTAFLAIFLADTGDADSENQVKKLAEGFLKQYRHSPYEPEVRMKLGEMLYRRGDYLGARGQFNVIAEEFSDSPLAEKALFLSAQAMARSMDPNAMEDAIEEFERVSKGSGPLAVQASLAQAVLYNALKRPKDALGVLDGILAAKPDAELRYTALIEKGDTFSALGAEDSANFQNAIEAWKLITEDPQAPKEWRYQAFAKMGAAYEKLHNTDAALNCYYSVFSDEQKGEPEYFWFYKAGFAAGDLLESQKLWKEAIAVYEKIGSIDGPRAEEAAGRVNKLRLENFIWEN